jgi:hypothetical protein
VSEPSRASARIELLAESAGQSYLACTLDPSAAFASPFADAPFPCLIWDHDGRATGEQRAAVVRALLEAGCRYFVCGGQNCKPWHDAADDEFLARHFHDPEAASDIDYVLTSSHENESVDGVAFFFVNCTNLHAHDFRRFLVLHVGERPDRGPLEAAVRRQVLDDDARGTRPAVASLR